MKIEELERACQVAGLRPIKKEEYKGATIFLAETDLETNQEYPFGYFQTAWFVATKDAKGLEVGRALNFKRDHDSEQGWSEEERRNKRLKAAIEDAQNWINDGHIPKS